LKKGRGKSFKPVAGGKTGDGFEALFKDGKR